MPRIQSLDPEVVSDYSRIVSKVPNAPRMIAVSKHYG
jgi:hypothetical protein